MHNSVKNRGLLVVLTLAVASVVGFSSYLVRPRDLSEQTVATSLKEGTTSVLGAATFRSGYLVPTILGFSQLSRDQIRVRLKVSNVSSEKLEFSPGLQVFLIDRSGGEIEVRSLPDMYALNGGPLEQGDSQEGYIDFVLNSKSVQKIRVYESSDRQYFREENLSI